MKKNATKKHPLLVKCLILCVVVLHSIGSAYAIPQNDLQDMNRSASAYNSLGTDLGDNSCAPSSGANTATGEAGSYPIALPKINDPEALANAINQYIKDSVPASPLNGLGKYFVEGGMRAGINPVLAVAQSRKESSFGTAGIATNGSHNAMGRRAVPTQPNVNMWYKYESWQKSLYADAFPASGKLAQPDDWFQYIARVYGDVLDSLDSFAHRYAPPEENNTQAYIDAITKFSGELLEIAGDSIDMSQLGSPSSAGCDDEGSGGSGSLSELTLGYAWPEYKGKPYREMMPEYKAAVEKAKAAGEYIGGTTYPGVDCGGFVTRLVVNSGFDPTYNHSAKGGYTGIQLQWVRNNWTKLGRGSEMSTAELQPGDVAFQVTSSGANDGHTFIFVGTISGFDSQIASASLDQRAPMAGRESILANNIEWYRKK